MPKGHPALINHVVLRWARISAHLDLDMAARSAAVPPQTLQLWEEGKAYPTVTQLRKLAKKYRQSFAAFFLPSTPSVPDHRLRDYRRMPGKTLEHLSYDLTIDIRDAINKRDIALELYQESGERPPEFEVDASIDETPESLGQRVRDLLKVTLREQREWRDPRVAFNRWRFAVEQLGVLVFQAGAVDLQEMRGFSLSFSPLPVIVVNRKDPYTARCFTLLHELVHLMLRAEGLCDLSNDPGRPPEEQRVEIYCNHVAGASLAPKLSLLNEPTLADKAVQDLTDAEVREIALRYSVSREVVLRRFLIFGLIDEDFYNAKRAQYRDEYKRQPKPKGFVSPAVDAVSTLGKPYVRLVLRSFNVGQITTSDVSEYLGVRLKHLKKIAESVAGD